MDISIFQEQFNVHDSYIENIGFELLNGNLIITLNFCNWAQADYEPNQPENLIGNLTFQEASGVHISNQYLALHDNRILDVRQEELDILTFVIEVPEPEGITLLSFRAKSVAWEPLGISF